MTLGTVLIGVFAAHAQTVQPVVLTTGAQLTFEKEVHDYGTLQQHADGTCEFSFTNTGNEPLIISNAKGSCGCTVPDWPHQPIAPGESAVVKVKYDTKRIGPINKSVSITSNSATKTVTVIRIKGKVVPMPESGAPVLQKHPGSVPTAVGNGGGK